MRRVLALVAVLTLAGVALASPAVADPPSPLVGHWEALDYGTEDTSRGTVVITPGGRYRITDEAGSICIGEVGFVPVTVQGTGTFSPDGLTFSPDPGATVYCYPGRGGRVDIGTIDLLPFVYDELSGRIADTGLPIGTCFWRTGTSQPPDCPPPA
jgi:hypothetical protein